jgi:hypothetical protein
MARPESIKNIKTQDRFVRIAMFEIDKIISNSALLKHYTALLEAAQKIGGNAEKSYSTVDISIPKDQKQLEEQLKTDQYYWDDKQKLYNRALRANPTDPIPEWQRSGLQAWAKDEGLPDPFDVFAANDPDIAAIRAEMGLDNDDDE